MRGSENRSALIDSMAVGQTTHQDPADRACDHDHSHCHDHGHGQADRTRLLWATILIGGFMIAEVVGGILSGSLALLADAGHMVTDFASLLLAYAGARICDRPADAKRTFGYHRVQVLTAFVNGLALVAISIWIVLEAIGRLITPVAIEGGLMLGVAALGLLVNMIAFAILHGGDRQNLNMRGALWHVAGDMLGSVAALLAAAIILTTEFFPADPILSLIVALILLRGAWTLIRPSVHILLEGAPDSLDLDQLAADLIATYQEIAQVHHVHAWSLTPDRTLVILHVVVDEICDRDALRERVIDRLQQLWGITHATVQVERITCTTEAVTDRP